MLLKKRLIRMINILLGLGWFELNETTNTNSILDRIFISLTLVIK